MAKVNKNIVLRSPNNPRYKEALMGLTVEKFPKLEAMVFCKTSFEAFHLWSEAPTEADFLRNRHRHIFHVELGVRVSHNDRNVEFITLKNQLTKFLRNTFEGKTFAYSCEMIGEFILKWAFGAGYDIAGVRVSEDDENGAYVVVSPNQSSDDHKKKNKWIEFMEEARVVQKKTLDNLEQINPKKPLITDLLSPNPFVGVEVEGPNRGAPTLFIPGCFPYDKLAAMLKGLKPLPEHIYYGAGNYTAVMGKPLEEILRVYNECYITVEIHSAKDVPSRLWILLNKYPQITIVSGDVADKDNVRVSYVKFINFKTNSIVWKYYNSGKEVGEYGSYINDPLYDEDKPVVFAHGEFSIAMQ